jgi:MFS family permease
MHPACGFIFGMFMSKYLMNLGRKRVMLLSILTTIITCFIMGISYYLKYHKTWFFIVNLIARGFMGMARSGYGSATFAYAPMLWP